jgi:transcription antitermination protein NusB
MTGPDPGDRTPRDRAPVATAHAAADKKPVIHAPPVAPSAALGQVAQLAASSGVRRSQARLAAVQALYQMDLAATDLNDVIREFVMHRFGEGADDPTFAAVDAEFFSNLLRGVVERQRDLDPELDQQLAAGWRLERIDAIVRAVLRSAMFELMDRRDVPARVVITEYVDVARAFFEGDEPKVVNAVLDKLARKHRPKEFGGRRKP